MKTEPSKTAVAAQEPEHQPVQKGDAPYKHIVIIINPAAGQDRPVLGAMNRGFQGSEVDWDVRITKKDGDAFCFAQEAVAAGVDAVGVYGGDGTVMEVASAMVGTNVPLAIFPGGTANVMSVELGIPADIAEATALACGLNSYVRDVDVGKVGDKFFLLRCGVGWEADMIQNADRESKDKMGRLAYVLSGIQSLTERKLAKYRLTLDGEKVDAEGVTLMVANSGNVGLPGLSLAKAINVSDGLLDVLVVRDADITSLLQVAASAVGLGDPLQHWQAREIAVESDVPLSVIRDGEPMGETPFKASIVPGGLKIIVPKQAVGSDEREAAEQNAKAATT